MTALPLRDFTDAERDRLAAIEAAPAAEESVRERVARAIFVAAGHDPERWEVVSPGLRNFHRKQADAAIAALSGPGPILPRPNSNGQVHGKGNCPECGRRIATRNGKIMYHYRAGYASECTGKGRAAVAGES